MPTRRALETLKSAEERLKTAEEKLRSFIERPNRQYSPEERAKNKRLLGGARKLPKHSEYKMTVKGFIGWPRAQKVAPITRAMDK